MPKKTARRIIDTRKDTGTTILTGVTVSGSPGSGASAAMAGDGLTYNSGVLDVGAGNGITVSADSVALASSTAGAGLTYSSGVLAVGAGNGITVNADDVALTTPGTLTAATSNSSASNHTHAITTGAASTLTVSTSNATGSSASLARADHLHTITASADVTAGTTALLKSASGNLKLATGNISSTLQSNAAFTSGFAGAGWNIDYGSTEAGKASATFDNLTVRGRMRVYELLIQQIRATNGSVLVSSTANTAKVVSTSDDPLWTVNGVQLTLNGANATLETTIYTLSTSGTWVAVGNVGNDTGHYHGFLEGDLIRAQRTAWDGSSFVGVVQSDLEVTGVSDLYTYQGARVATGGDAPAVGYDFVRIGSASDTSRQGAVYLTSDDDNAPFIDIVDGVRAHSDWNTAGKIRARLGRLDGITDAQWGTLDGYGLWSDNVYLTGNIYATDGIFNGTVYATDGIFSGTVYASAGTFTGAITAQSGSIAGVLNIASGGEIQQGTGTLGSNFTGLRMWYDTGVGRIGGYNNNTLQWYAGTDGYLYGGDGSTSRFRLGNESFRSVINTGSFKYGFAFIDTITASDWTAENLYGTLYSWKVTTSGSEELRMFFASRVNSSLYTTYDSKIDIAAQSSNGTTVRTSNLVLAANKNGGVRTMTYSGDYFYLDGYMWFKPVTAPGTPASGVVLYCSSSDGKLYSKNSSGATQQLSA